MFSIHVEEGLTPTLRFLLSCSIPVPAGLASLEVTAVPLTISTNVPLAVVVVVVVDPVAYPFLSAMRCSVDMSVDLGISCSMTIARYGIGYRV